MNWHISCVLSKREDKEQLGVTSYVHLFEVRRQQLRWSPPRLDGLCRNRGVVEQGSQKMSSHICSPGLVSE